MRCELHICLPGYPAIWTYLNVDPDWIQRWKELKYQRKERTLDCAVFYSFYSRKEQLCMNYSVCQVYEFRSKSCACIYILGECCGVDLTLVLSKGRMDCIRLRNHWAKSKTTALHCKYLSLWLCMAGLSCGHSGLLCSGRKNRHLRSVHLTRLNTHKKKTKAQGLMRTQKYFFLVLSLSNIKRVQVIIWISVCGNYKVTSQILHLSNPHLLRNLHDAFCHKILLGPSCCSRDHQRVGHRGQVSACPWACAVVHNGSAPQRGYSWRSQCTWEHRHSTVSVWGQE